MNKTMKKEYWKAVEHFIIQNKVDKKEAKKLIKEYKKNIVSCKIGDIIYHEQPHEIAKRFINNNKT